MRLVAIVFMVLMTFVIMAFGVLIFIQGAKFAVASEMFIILDREQWRCASWEDEKQGLTRAQDGKCRAWERNGNYD